MILTKRFSALLAGAVFSMAVIFTGCGKKPVDTLTNVLRVAFPGSISTLDVNQEAGVLNYYVSSIVQEGLVSISNEGKIIPALAESWTDTDARVWTFQMRKDALFHDGTPVTPGDVIYSLQRVMDPLVSPGTNTYFTDNIVDMKQTGEYEITITLGESSGSFLWSVSNTGGLFVTSRAWTERVEQGGTVGSPQDLIIGTGPYKAAEFVPGSHALFEAADTWRGEVPAIKRVYMGFIEDDNTRLLAFQQGEFDFTINIPVDQTAQWEKIRGVTVSTLSDRTYQGITLDPTVTPFDDIHVRRAVAYSIDKTGIVQGILRGHGEAATAIPAPLQFAAALDETEAREKLASVFRYEYSPENAKAELAKSKAAQGFSTTLTYPASYQSVGRASLAIAESLKSIGIAVEVKEIPLDQWLNEVGNGKQGIAWMIYGPTSADPGEITSWLLDAQGPGFNPANWTNPAVAALTADVSRARTIAEQIEPIIRSNSLAQEEAVYAPVYWGETAVAFAEGVTADYTSYTLLSKWPLLFTKKAR
jgi:peptide/nickel transport system substrate-binding protein